MADFLAELPGEVEGKTSLTVNPAPRDTWELYTDGAASSGGSGAGLILTSPSGEEHTYALRFDFPATNNEAEYEALIAGLRIAEQMDITSIQVFVDSQLVANQVNGSFEAKEQAMKRYLEVVQEMTKKFQNFKIDQVPRSQNKKADVLSKLASLTFAHLTKEVLVEVLKEKSIDTNYEANPIEESGDNWMTPIREYLLNGTLPADRALARKIRVKAPMYTIEKGELLRKSFLGPNLRCVGPKQAENIIREVHEGSCGLHSGPRAITGKLMRHGYFWPSMHQDTLSVVQKCQSCQIHAPVSRTPKHDLIPVTSPWPFSSGGSTL